MAIRLPCWGRVVLTGGVVPWVVVDPAGEPVEPILRFLRDFVARDNRRGSVRSYCWALLRWWRWLKVIEVEWDEVTSAEVRDDFYQPRTVQHGNAVVRSFYEFWIEAGSGPLVNPVVLDRRGGRAHAHHNPLEPFRAGGRIRYSPKIPRRRPRGIPDEQWNALFAALRSNRDPGDRGPGRQQPGPRLGDLGHPGRRSGLGRAAGAGLAQGQRRGSVAAGQPGGVRLDPSLPGRDRPAGAGGADLADPAEAWCREEPGAVDL